MTGDGFRPFSDARKILLAVSGGPDSMALLHLSLDWARARSTLLEAASVDHGLRPEASDECRQVADWCRSLGVPHHVLTWEGEKPRSRLQERARTARYELLFARARAIGAEAVFTAHHADDQAETILYRLLRGSGIAGLAGMAEVSWRDGLRLGRPLLACDKADLVAVCRARGQAYVEDPSNEDPRFARVRMRRLLALMAREGLASSDLQRLARRAARAEAALAGSFARLAGTLDIRRSPATCEIDLAPLREEALEFLLRLLLAEAGRLAGSTPRLERAEPLAERLQAALRAGEGMRGTLAGLLIRLSPHGRLSLSPEAPRQRGAPRSTAVHVTV